MSEYIRAVTLLGADYPQASIPRANIEADCGKNLLVSSFSLTTRHTSPSL